MAKFINLYQLNTQTVIGWINGPIIQINTGWTWIRQALQRVLSKCISTTEHTWNHSTLLWNCIGTGFHKIQVIFNGYVLVQKNVSIRYRTVYSLKCRCFLRFSKHNSGQLGCPSIGMDSTSRIEYSGVAMGEKS